MKDAKPGHAVEFQGLKGAAHLNGERGHLVRFDKNEQRWVVECDDESNGTVKAKAANLKRVSGYPKIPGEKSVREIMAKHYAGRPKPPLPPMNTSSKHGDVISLNDAVLDSYYKRKINGVVVFFGDEYMLAVEFFGPKGARGAEVEMVYVDNEQSSQAVVQKRKCASAKELGRYFLLGGDAEYIEATNRGAFLDLLKRYQIRARLKHDRTDAMSGLRLYEAYIA